jgi:hypothetical protein
MSKRKTAQRGPATSKAPESKRRWLIIDTEKNEPTIGCMNAFTNGLSNEELAQKRSKKLVLKTHVVAYHEFFGLPDPDEVSE